MALVENRELMMVLMTSVAVPIGYVMVLILHRSSRSGKLRLIALVENRELVMVLTTSVAVLIGCVVVLIFCRSSGQKLAKAAGLLRPLTVKVPESVVDDGRKKITVFFGMQTGQFDELLDQN